MKELNYFLGKSVVYIVIVQLILKLNLLNTWLIFDRLIAEKVDLTPKLFQTYLKINN